MPNPTTIPFKDDRLPGGLRTGQQFLDAIANDGRRVFRRRRRSERRHDASGICGDRADDGVAFRYFQRPGECGIDDLHVADDGTAGQSHLAIAGFGRGVAATARRHRAMGRGELWFHGAHSGSRRGLLYGYAAAPEVLARNGNEKHAANAVKIYEYLRDNDIYIAYTIVPPQIDRSKPAHQQNPPDLYAGVVEEREDGVIIKGAQMLGTGAVFADYIHLSTIHPLRPGDENHAVSLIVPANAPGVKIHSATFLRGRRLQYFRLPVGVAVRRDRFPCRLRQRLRAVGIYIHLQGYGAVQ